LVNIQNTLLVHRVAKAMGLRFNSLLALDSAGNHIDNWPTKHIVSLIVVKKQFTSGSFTRIPTSRKSGCIAYETFSDRMKVMTNHIKKVIISDYRFACLSSILLLAAVIIMSPGSARAMTVQGVTFAETVRAGNTVLTLHNAALLRYMKFIKAYVAAVYLPEGVAPDKVLDDVAKRLEISYLVSIKGPDFAKGAEPVLRRNQAAEELSRLRSRIDHLNAIYRDVKPGDRYALTYLPGRGTELSLNGVPLTVIQGADFAKAYFGVWLGREPIDARLKRELLKNRAK
jgi:hypothetical protein